MDNQITITGTVGQVKTAEPDNSNINNTPERIVTMQIYYGELPKTNEYIIFYYLGLGIVFILISFVIWRLRKSCHK